MTFLSSLADDQRPLVLDTSVLINLHASTYGERVLTAIANNIVVPDIVAEELEHETSRTNGDQSFFHGLIENGKVTIADMTDEEYELFATLSGGSTSLDDGEAATIAIAARRGFRPVVDERRGRAQAVAFMRGEEPGWSLDLIRHPLVVQSLGDPLSANAVYFALRYGRMRIAAEHSGEVVRMIGRERALECSSLPNFRSLKKVLTASSISQPPANALKEDSAT